MTSAGHAAKLAAAISLAINVRPLGLALLGCAVLALLALAAFALVPIVGAIVRHATLYDGVRHLLFIIPPVAHHPRKGMGKSYCTRRALDVVWWALGLVGFASRQAAESTTRSCSCAARPGLSDHKPGITRSIFHPLRVHRSSSVSSE